MMINKPLTEKLAFCFSGAVMSTHRSVWGSQRFSDAPRKLAYVFLMVPWVCAAQSKGLPVSLSWDDAVKRLGRPPLLARFYWSAARFRSRFLPAR